MVGKADPDRTLRDAACGHMSTCAVCIIAHRALLHEQLQPGAGALSRACNLFSSDDAHCFLRAPWAFLERRDVRRLSRTVLHLSRSTPGSTKLQRRSSYTLQLPKCSSLSSSTQLSSPSGARPSSLPPAAHSQPAPRYSGRAWFLNTQAEM